MPDPKPEQDSTREYLELSYKEALNHIRCHIDSRYKILHFIGAYNAALIAIGFSPQLSLFSTAKGSLAGILLSSLSLLIAAMGLITEFSLVFYNTTYYRVVKLIEEQLNHDFLRNIGVFTYGDRELERHAFFSRVRVNVIHKSFYLLLALFWAGFLIYQIVLFQK